MSVDDKKLEELKGRVDALQSAVQQLQDQLRALREMIEGRSHH